jgi:mannose-6-phosphate isomerase-like protein (cupin superfamily)
MKFTPEELLAKLPLPADEKWKQGVWDVELLKKGKVSLVFFAPRNTDYQTFHEEDEFYVIIRGKGDLIIGSDTFCCEVGDAFYVPAKTPHHFENFTEDFTTWSVFF